jgi:outer membrane protein assembly factor BamB
VIKKASFLLSIFFLFSCSFGDVGGFWSNEKKINQSDEKYESIFKTENITSKEFNKNLEISFHKENLRINKNSHLDNNDGFVNFGSGLKKISKYKFSKIKSYKNFQPNLIFSQNNIIFFDNKGSILNFNDESKLVWKKNNYTKEEKKINPLITLAKNKNQIFLADNFANYYSLKVDDGELLWSKKHKSPFNSEIKIYKDKLFIVDTNNTINCYSTLDGSKIWSYSTDKSFVNSSKKLSIIIKGTLIVFSNSIGDLTALDLNSGNLQWQFSYLNSENYEEIMTLKTSALIENENSIYFSTNKNKFYSIDLISGGINWIQKINSEIKPLIIEKIIFTISKDGYLYVVDKISGNIIKIKNIFKNTELEKTTTIYPTGFLMSKKEIFISSNNGKLYIFDILEDKVLNIFKIDSSKISRPIVNNRNMYVIKDDAIIRLN